MFIYLDLQVIIRKLSINAYNDEVISHAMSVRRAWALKQYSKFFKLYQSAPKMSGYIMDWFLMRERKFALKVIVKSYVFFIFLKGLLSAKLLFKFFKVVSII